MADPLVIDLLNSKEVANWSRGERKAWESKDSLRILYEFGPKGRKRLGEWSSAEKQSLLQALEAKCKRATSREAWALVSVAVEGHSRTGRQCESFARSLRLPSCNVVSSEGGDDLDDKWEKEKRTEAVEFAETLLMTPIDLGSSSLDDDGIAELKIELEDGRVIPEGDRLLLDSSRSVSSAALTGLRGVHGEPMTAARCSPTTHWSMAAKMEFSTP